MTEWQPIETAPRDGWLLLAHTNGRITIGYAVEDDDGNYGQFGDDTGTFEESFTHWMHLPQPPKEDAK